MHFPNNRIPAGIVLLCLLVAAGTAGVALYLFNPENSVWFPKCPFYLLTGYQCPACGIQRAAYHLLHLHLATAFRYNPFLVLSLPYAFLLVTSTCILPLNRLTGLRTFCLHPVTVRTYLALMLLWWVVRNLL